MCLAIVSCASATFHFKQPIFQAIHNQPAQYAANNHVGSQDAGAQVIRIVSDISSDNAKYNYEYETGNGIAAKETGHAAKSVEGSYSYTAPDGAPVSITYIANENGYQPTGAHLPVAPATPPHVVRLVEYLRVHGQKENEPVAHYTQAAPVARYTQAAPVARYTQAAPVAPVAPVAPNYFTTKSLAPAQPAYKPFASVHAALKSFVPVQAVQKPFPFHSFGNKF